MRQLASALVLCAAVTLVCCAPLCVNAAPASSVGEFEGRSDVGSVLHPGVVAYDAAAKSYTITGSGANMWTTEDAFQFVWKKVSGDVALSADIRFPKEGKNPHRKAVLVLRQSLDADSVYADAALHGVGLTALQYRPQKGAMTSDVELNFTKITDAPTRFRIEKRGDHISMLVSFHGEPLHPSGATARVHLEGPFYVGLGVCSHDKDVSETAVFSNVEIHELSAMKPMGTTPTLHSTLTTISINPNAPVATVVYATAGRMEAPNWSRDGKLLVFNMAGRIMTAPAEGGEPKAIEIGAATGCNGSHGVSPDGKDLAISCNMPDAPSSRVYRVPLSGGTPRVVTQNPSSYFHGWSPDGKTIAFTRPHPGGGDIWSIPAEGGQETRTTTTAGISDDPDYSPDGQWIYFNSDRGGSMQIWRMKPDGSNQEQVTNDDFNNWFPHASPDSKRIVFVTFARDVTGHPENKDVTLRLMTLADRKIQVLGKMFGGQGTANVPCWSPDGKQIAFVTYQLLPATVK